MVCQRSRERKGEKKALPCKSPLKKRVSNAAESTVAPLTLEILDSMASATNLKPSSPASVTDDSRSDTSSSNSPEEMSLSPPQVSVSVIPKGITSDKAFLAQTLKKRDEMERLRVAKVMLYDAYLKAVQG